MIEILGFNKNYYNFSHKNKLFSVKNISIKVEPKKITALLGQNGSGKTTILKAVCGFHYPTYGEIILSDNDGNKIKVNENQAEVRNFVGYVPEQSILPGEMKVLQFLKYAGEVHGLSGNQLDDSLSYVINKCELSSVLDKKIKNLSKGFAQRTSFAQAIIHNPPNLILDEAITGLDPAQIIQMRSLIQELSKTKSILMSTHILQEVDSLCSDIYIIKEGEIKISGTKEKIIEAKSTKSLEEAFFKIMMEDNDEK